jgi:glycosyltransferase involved in cell wall biosynthesis
VIRNPVITPELDRLAAEPCPHPWLAPGEPPVILGAGRLQRQKDFPTLIRAFARLPRAAGCRLGILGEGGGRSKLETLIGSSV